MMQPMYFNAAGTSWPKPPAVSEAIRRASSVPPVEWPTTFEEAHRSVAAHFCVESDDLLITPSCTSALSTVIADLPIPPSARIVTSTMEHHAVSRPLALWERRGADIVRIPRGVGPFDLEVYRREVERGVDAIVVSAVAGLTGEALPLEAIVELAEGAVVVVDGAQAAGWIPFDLGALEVDAFAFAGHKGPQGPTGVGGVYLRPGRIWTTPLASCSSDACRPRPGYCDTGSVSLPGLVGLASGLAWMEEHRSLGRQLEHTRRLRAELTAMGAEVLGVMPVVPTTAFVVNGATPASIAAELRRDRRIVSAGFQCAPDAHRALGTDAQGAVRVSFGPMTCTSEVDGLIDAMKNVTSPSFLRSP